MERSRPWRKGCPPGGCIRRVQKALRRLRSQRAAWIPMACIRGRWKRGRCRGSTLLAKPSMSPGGWVASTFSGRGLREWQRGSRFSRSKRWFGLSWPRASRFPTRATKSLQGWSTREFVVSHPVGGYLWLLRDRGLRCGRLCLRWALRLYRWRAGSGGWCQHKSLADQGKTLLREFGLKKLICMTGKEIRLGAVYGSDEMVDDDGLAVEGAL